MKTETRKRANLVDAKLLQRYYKKDKWTMGSKI